MATIQVPGTDFSGNGNDWWDINIDTTQDTCVDSPSNVFTTANDVGGVVPGNYATLNPLDSTTNSSLTNGNLSWTNQSGVGNCYPKTSTFWGPGKWYMEVTVTNGGTAGIADTGAIGCMVYDPAVTYSSRAIGYGSNDFAWRFDGYKANNGTTTAYGTAVNANNDVVMMAWDTSNNTMWVGKNGTWFGSGNPATASNPTWADSARTDLQYLFKPVVWSKHGASGTLTNFVNFGQRPFSYTPPAGFYSLNTTNLQAQGSSAVAKAGIKPFKHFDVTYYAGSGVSQNITNSGSFQPDMIWEKRRDGSAWHIISDSVRGSGYGVWPNAANAESSYANYLTSFNSNGFTVSPNVSADPIYWNVLGQHYAAWQWKGGQGVTTTNTNGSITSTVSANPDAGFSIVSYTLNNSTFTVGHGLNTAPKMIWVKDRDTANNWDVYHTTAGAGYRYQLNSSAAPDATTTPWNNTAPTSTVFSGNSSWWSSPSTSRMIAYCFAEVPGFSKFGTYVGNGSSDGPFVYCGFRPKWLLVKGFGAQNWCLMDTTKSPYNGASSLVFSFASNSNADGGNEPIDFLSNGFKLRTSGASDTNASSVTYMFAAFAESPVALNNRAR